VLKPTKIFIKPYDIDKIGQLLSEI